MKIDINDPNIENAKYIKPLHFSKIKNLKSSNVEDFSTLDVIKSNFYKMIKTCIKDDGIGLAAPQIGILKNMIVVRDLTEQQYFNCYVNLTYAPIVESSKELAKEACLSVPGNSYMISRWNKIEVSYVDLSDLSERSKILEGYEARIIQHEKDHILGKSIVEVFTLQNKKGK